MFFSNESQSMQSNYQFIESCLNLNQKRPIDSPSTAQLSNKKMREWDLNAPQLAVLDSKCDKRNERERNRVRLINKEFESLADLVFNSNFKPVTAPIRSSEKENNETCRKKRQYSKLNILKISIAYIQYLQELLESQDEFKTEVCFVFLIILLKHFKILFINKIEFFNFKFDDSMDYLQMSFLASDLDSAIGSASSSFTNNESNHLHFSLPVDPEFVDLNDSFLYI
jgi:hypothetical protein